MKWKEMETKRKYFLYFILIWLAYRFWGNTLFSQLGETVIQYPSIDNTFWLFNLLGIPKLMTHNSLIAALADVMFLFLPLLLLKNWNKWLSILLTLLLTIYYITYSTYACHHVHSLVALIFVSVIFWTKDELLQKRVMEAVRYYFLFAMASAAIWKLARGSVFEVNHLSTILSHQHAQWMADYPNGFMTSFYQYLIQNTTVSYTLYLSAIMLELAFLEGFFTKKSDVLIAILFITFLIFNYLVMGVFSFELLPFLLVLEINRKSEN